MVLPSIVITTLMDLITKILEANAYTVLTRSFGITRRENSCSRRRYPNLQTTENKVWVIYCIYVLTIQSTTYFTVSVAL